MSSGDERSLGRGEFIGAADEQPGPVMGPAAWSHGIGAPHTGDQRVLSADGEFRRLGAGGCEFA
jgi:hypothetical protein